MGGQNISNAVENKFHNEKNNAIINEIRIDESLDIMLERLNLEMQKISRKLKREKVIKYKKISSHHEQ